ncbi:MAG: ABC transporter permease [Coriobacteriia bacterium]|nr:ABC transporter permease [Coriobacteriia bacterium]
MSFSLTSLVEQFKHDWFVLSSLVSKDFKLKYRRSILGVVWSVLNPLLMMMVMSAVFIYIFRGDETTQPYPVYLILGTTLFSLMSSSTSSGASSILNSASLIKKIRINKMIFPFEKVLFELVNFALSLVAVVIVLVFFRVRLTLNLVFIPLLLFYVTLFCAGLALLLSALAVFFTDIIYLWGVILTAWTYATPLFYPVLSLDPTIQALMRFNPMYHYVTFFRSIIMCGYDALAWQTPSLGDNLYCLGFGLITLVAGVLVFKATEKRFILFV